jgi:hypothetical protein
MLLRLGAGKGGSTSWPKSVKRHVRETCAAAAILIPK